MRQTGQTRLSFYIFCPKNKIIEIKWEQTRLIGQTRYVFILYVFVLRIRLTDQTRLTPSSNQIFVLTLTDINLSWWEHRCTNPNLILTSIITYLCAQLKLERFKCKQSRRCPLKGDLTDWMLNDPVSAGRRSIGQWKESKFKEPRGTQNSNQQCWTISGLIPDLQWSCL